jgi:circadian clock protein KaiC
MSNGRLPVGMRAEPHLLRTGVPRLDDILLGGLSEGRIYLVEGDPGTGKTTLATQFILEGHGQGERCLYVTLSESKLELELGAESHGWSMDGVPIAEFVPEEANLSAEDQYTVFHPSEVELATTIRKLISEIERVNPERLVIDALTDFRLLAQDAIRYRRQLLALKQFFMGRNLTVLLLDDRTSQPGDLQVHSLVHGVVRLENLRRSYSASRRRMEIVKMRGRSYLAGFHDYTIDREGVVIYPRLVTSGHGGASAAQQPLPSGLPALDAMFGGNMERNSSTLILGPTGVGKSSLAMQYAFAAAERGERAVLYSFDEALYTMRTRTLGLGMRIDDEIANGHLYLEQIDPAEVSPGEFVYRIRREVEERDAKVVVLDSLNGLQHSMPGEGDLALILHQLLIFLSQKNVATFLVLAQRGLVGTEYEDLEIGYLADNMLLMRFFEVAASIRRAISVVKKRSGAHEPTIREFRMGADGIHVGEELVSFKGILSGMPDFQKLPTAA